MRTREPESTPKPPNTRRVQTSPSSQFGISMPAIDVSNGHRVVVLVSDRNFREPVRLTPDNARRLARILNNQAEAAEHDVNHGGTAS